VHQLLLRMDWNKQTKNTRVLINTEEEVDTNAEDRSRAYATGPDFILIYLFLSCRGTGPIFV